MARRPPSEKNAGELTPPNPGARSGSKVAGSYWWGEEGRSDVRVLRVAAALDWATSLEGRKVHSNRRNGIGLLRRLGFLIGASQEVFSGANRDRTGDLLNAIYRSTEVKPHNWRAPSGNRRDNLSQRIITFHNWLHKPRTPASGTCFCHWIE